MQLEMINILIGKIYWLGKLCSDNDQNFFKIYKKYNSTG